jgi:hypothetical protein
MKTNDILALIENVLAKGVLKKISKYSKVLADDIASSTKEETIMALIEKNIKYCNENELPDKAEFLEILKTEWKSIPQETQTKLLILLFVEEKYIRNIFTSTMIVATYYNYKNP